MNATPTDFAPPSEYQINHSKTEEVLRIEAINGDPTKVVMQGPWVPAKKGEQQLHKLYSKADQMLEILLGLHGYHIIDSCNPAIFIWSRPRYRTNLWKTLRPAIPIPASIINPAGLEIIKMGKFGCVPFGSSREKIRCVDIYTVSAFAIHCGSLA